MQEPCESFERHLTEKDFQSARNHPNLVALLQYCRADSSLSIFLRGKALDVYWEGFVVFHVTFPTGLRIGSQSDTPVAGWPTTLDDLDPALLPEHIAWVKNLRAEKVATRAPELRFEAAVIRDNQAVGAPVVVIDRQIARPGHKGQLDLMLLDVGSSRLALAELKVQRNPQIGGPVLEQLQGYVNAFGELAPEYAKVLCQMQRLGLAANRQATIDPDQPPIPIVMLAGVPVRRLGAPSDSRALHTLRQKNKEIPATCPDARMLVFPRQADQSFSIPTSLEELPTIEDWCARNLSESPLHREGSVDEEHNGWG